MTQKRDVVNDCPNPFCFNPAHKHDSGRAKVTSSSCIVSKIGHRAASVSSVMCYFP